MTEHADTNDSSDPIDIALSGAGERLRRQAPDAIASRQVLARMNEHADAPRPERRSWWPALIGAGLAGAAVVGAIALRSDGNETPTLTPVTEPTSIEPTTTPAPNPTNPGATGASLLVESGCITVTTDVGSATGCPLGGPELNQLDQRTFVANLDGPVLVTASSADPLVDLTAAVDTGGFASRCGWEDLASRVPDGGLVEVVVCSDTGVIGLTTPTGPFGDKSMSYFTLPTPYLPDGADLGLGTPIDGMPGAVAFTAAVDGSVTCSILLVPDRSGWKESCGVLADTDGQGALVTIDEIGAADTSIWEVTIDGSGVIDSALPVAEMAPSSGCSINSTIDLIRLLPASSVVTGVGCIDDKAALVTGSVLTQDGPPDGSIWTALRTEDVWAITDSGTGIETTLLFPIVPFAIWSTWPESTVPGFRSYWWEPIVAIPAQPTVDAFADAMITTLGTLGTDPEFPLNERLVEVQPGGLDLIVAQVDIGGDDSVAGMVIYVWLDQEFGDIGPIGWRAGAVLAGNACARGESTGLDLCI